MFEIVKFSILTFENTATQSACFIYLNTTEYMVLLHSTTKVNNFIYSSIYSQENPIRSAKNQDYKNDLLQLYWTKAYTLLVLF